MEDLSTLFNIAITILICVGFGMLLIFILGVMINRGMKRERGPDRKDKAPPAEK